MESIQKTTFRQSRNFDDLKVVFVDLGTILMIFGALRTGLKFDDFSWPPMCAQEVRVGRSWVMAAVFWGPPNQSESIAADSMWRQLGGNSMENTWIQKCSINLAAWCPWIHFRKKYTTCTNSARPKQS